MTIHHSHSFKVLNVHTLTQTPRKLGYVDFAKKGQGEVSPIEKILKFSLRMMCLQEFFRKVTLTKKKGKN